MKTVLFFDTMLTPKLITLIYWLMSLGAVIVGVASWFSGPGLFGIGKLLGGLAIAFFGVVFSRIFCELMIVLFKMNEALQAIREK